MEDDHYNLILVDSAHHACIMHVIYVISNNNRVLTYNGTCINDMCKMRIELCVCIKRSEQHYEHNNHDINIQDMIELRGTFLMLEVTEVTFFPSEETIYDHY